MSYRRANFLASSVTFVEWILLAGLAVLPCFRRHRVPRTPAAATHTSSAGRGSRDEKWSRGLVVWLRVSYISTDSSVVESGTVYRVVWSNCWCASLRYTLQTREKLVRVKLILFVITVSDKFAVDFFHSPIRLCKSVYRIRTAELCMFCM